MTDSKDRDLGVALEGRRLIVVANREPYIHDNIEGDVVVRRPAGGLVTGIEPLLVASGGVWIAHGSGSADRSVVDEHGIVAVPPENPSYSLRRIFLSQEQVRGYYEGFANEALWPLCHLAYTKPRFRREDFEHYREVNRIFASAALEASDESSLILVQDYHFALAPSLLRARGAAAPIHLFWHIPWPSAEVFRICPWGVEILEGMLGADIVGFHSDYYGRNFIDCCDVLLDGSEVDREAMTVRHQGRTTRVRRYPISIDWPVDSASRDDGKRVREKLGISPDTHISIGVDRVDYTKGLLERLSGIERFLEREPGRRRRFVFIELASPSRTTIDAYRQLNDSFNDEVGRINDRFSEGDWKPVILERRVLPLAQLRAYYAAADSGLVTPLHDGMNLVAKEYVASCIDDEGVLILSRFTGAAEELEEAILVNPYDADGIADAIVEAIEMPRDEKIRRMKALRERIANNTIYDWARAIVADTIAIDTEGIS